jgi:hypothetical protein
MNKNESNSGDAHPDAIMLSWLILLCFRRTVF